MVFDLFPALFCALQRSCTVHASENPSGSSTFADDMALHSDCPDAILAMLVIVNAGGAFKQWLDLFVSMHQAVASGI